MKYLGNQASHWRKAARVALFCAAGLGSLAVTAPALAQDQGDKQDGAAKSASDDGTDTDIIVTALRRDTSLLETPVAVSVASGDTLRQKDVVQPADLIKVTPGLTAQVGAESSRRTFRFAIRGQGGTSNNDSGVSTYFSDVPAFGVPYFYDLQNVQVLKGPQGTLFGRVTTGGAVLITPQMPTNDFSGYVDLKLGQYGRRDVEFAVGGALIPDVLAVRVSGQLVKSDGFTRNLYDGSGQDGSDGQAFRAIVKFTPTSWLTNTTIGVLDYLKDPTRSAQITNVRPVASNQARVSASVAAMNNIPCPGGICPTWYELEQQQIAAGNARSVYVSDENAINYPRINNRHWGFINTTVAKVLPHLTLKNILSYQETDAIGASQLNIDATPYPILEQILPAGKGGRSMTEEFQIQASLFDIVDLTSGVYYEHQWTPTFQQGVVIFYGVPAQYSFSKTNNDDFAVYSQATLHITDALSLTAGYRYTWSKRRTSTVSGINSATLAASTTIPSYTIPFNGVGLVRVAADLSDMPGATTTRGSFEEGTYTFAAQYQFSRDFMVYATTRKGYKPGGQNSVAPAGYLTYGPEIVTDYEIGAKLGWHMGDLHGLVSVDAYRDNYNNAQRNVTQPVCNTATPPVCRSTVFTANVAKARIQGFDIDGSVTYGWFTLGGFVTLTDGKYLVYPNSGQFVPNPALGITAADANFYAPPYDLTQMPLSNMSKWVWGLQPSIAFDKMLTGAPDIVLSGNIYHRGTFASSEPDVGPDIAKIIPGYTTVDMRLDWRNIHDTGLSVAFAVTNLTDFNGKVGGNELRTTNGINVDVFSPPRQWYFELNYKF